jgi:hypothetical protein
VYCLIALVYVNILICFWKHTNIGWENIKLINLIITFLSFACEVMQLGAASSCNDGPSYLHLHTDHTRVKEEMRGGRRWVPWISIKKSRPRPLHCATQEQTNLSSSPVDISIIFRYTPSRHASPRRSLWRHFLPAAAAHSYTLGSDRYALARWFAGRRRDACLQQRQVRAWLLRDQEQQFHAQRLKLVSWNMGTVWFKYL